MVEARVCVRACVRVCVCVAGRTDVFDCLLGSPPSASLFVCTRVHVCVSSTNSVMNQ